MESLVLTKLNLFIEGGPRSVNTILFDILYTIYSDHEYKTDRLKHSCKLQAAISSYKPLTILAQGNFLHTNSPNKKYKRQKFSNLAKK